MTVHERVDAGERPYRLRVNDFLLLDRAGCFEELGRTELRGGEIYVMNAQHRPHGHAKMRLYDALRLVLGDNPRGLDVAVEVSIALTAHDAPEPDLTLTSEPLGEGLIPAASVALVVEIADATIRTDLRDKAMMYAAANIPEYWVVDLTARVIHQLWKPTDGAFAERQEVAFGQPLAAATIADLVVATDRL